MAHTRAGYEFNLRASRVTLWIACLGGVVGAVGGLGCAILAFRPLAEQPATWWSIEGNLIGGGVRASALGVLVFLLSAIALRRALVVANECRIGEAGILTRTLLQPEQFIPWIRFRGSRLEGRLLVIRYDTADGIEGETWVEIPWGQGATALRMKTFLAEKQRAWSERRERDLEHVPTPV